MTKQIVLVSVLMAVVAILLSAQALAQGPLPPPLPGFKWIEVKPSTLDPSIQSVCRQNGIWHFVQTDSLNSSDQITITFGPTVTVTSVPRNPIKGNSNSANYTTTANITLTVTNAVALVPTGFTGQFNLSCGKATYVVLSSITSSVYADEIDEEQVRLVSSMVGLLIIFISIISLTCGIFFRRWVRHNR